MIKTKHDLSAGVAILNLDEMISAAQIAVSFARMDLERSIGDVQQKHFKNDQMGAVFATQHLAETAEGLRKLQINYHYLLEAKYREIKIKVDNLADL